VTHVTSKQDTERGFRPVIKNDSDASSFIRRLKEKLMPYYELPHALGDHDVWHVSRVAQMGRKIKNRCRQLDFDLVEFEVVAWLHNIDRVEPFRSEIGRLRNEGNSETAALALVASEFFSEEHPFVPQAVARIVDAVAQHSKKDDERGDSHLLTALRIADKLDRLNPVGFLSVVVGSAADLPIYNPKCPFGVGSTVEGCMKSIYETFFRLLEWVPMLPLDEARALIEKNDLRACIDFVRALGIQLARENGVPNMVEDDIKKALGPYYRFYAT